MREHDLDELLAAIDAPVDAPAEAEERVWQTLRPQLFAESPETSNSSPDDGDVIVVEVDWSSPAPIDRINASRRRRRTIGTLVAAAVVVVLAGLAAVLLDDRTDDVRVTDDPLPTVPAPIDRPEACLRFRVDSPLLDDLEAAVTANPATAPALIDQTRDGLDQLRADLEAAASLTALEETQTFSTLDGALNQARLFLLADDVDAARQAIDFAQQTYDESDLASDTCLG